MAQWGKTVSRHSRGEVLVNIQTKIATMENCGTGSKCLGTCYIKSWECASTRSEYLGLDCLKNGTSGRGTPPPKIRMKKDQWDTMEIHFVVISFGYSFSLSLPLLLYFALPISFYLFTSHLLLNKICNTDFGIWYGLHLNFGRGISYNGIITTPRIYYLLWTLLFSWNPHPGVSICDYACCYSL